MRRPRWITRRRLLVVVAVVGAALAIAVVLGATRVFGHKRGDPRRTAVAAYITSVDSVQQRMRLQLTHVLSAYRSFSTNGTGPAVAARLSGAEQTLRTLEARIAALPAPADAARLRRLLLALVQGELAVSHELNALASFMPRFHAIVAVATAANSTLGRGLAAATPPKPHTVRGTAKQVAAAQAAYAAQASRAAAAQADAVDAYDRTLGQVVRRLRLVHPPAVMAPAHQAELRMLRATRKAGAALAAELRKRNRSRVPELSRALSKAARLAASIAAQRSEIAAVKAYNARVRQIGNDQARVQAEVARLQRRLR